MLRTPITPEKTTRKRLISSLLIYYLTLTVLLFLASPVSAIENTEMMLPKVYKKQELIDWMWSEKLDGLRGRWTGKEMLTKGGNTINIPPYFLKNFPPFPLDGEIWGGRQTFEKTSSIVKTSSYDKGWDKLQYGIFDAPEHDAIIEDRLDKAKKWFASHPSEYAFIIPQHRLASKEELAEKLTEIERLGGEGIIVVKRGSKYTNGRSVHILKVKNFEDAEAIVTGYTPGKGKHHGKMGSLVVELVKDREIVFKIGTGFSDEIRDNPPPIGAMITFKYTGKYVSGKPKFPSFIRVRSLEGGYL